MVTVVKEVIYLGTFSDADTDEGTREIEDNSVYQQTFGSVGSPLNNARESMTFDDADNNGFLETNNFATSDGTTGAGGASQVDSLVTANVTVTYLNGTTDTFDNVVMFQTTNGELFLTNSNFAGTDIRGPEQRELQSITVNSITSSTYSALMQNALQTFACFVEGTRLAVPHGSCAIEDLKVGDLVETLDRGPRPIRWIGASTVLPIGKMAPVTISKGALGRNYPHSELRVSQQHRMLIRSKVITRMIGDSEAMIAAKFLLPLNGVELTHDIVPMRYLHLLFDRHEVVIAEGTPSESLFPGPQAMEVLGPESSTQVNSLISNMKHWQGGGKPARHFLEGAQRKRAVERHIKNSKPVMSSHEDIRRPTQEVASAG